MTTRDVQVGCAVPVLPGSGWSALARRDAIAAIAEAGLDHLMVGDHVSFFGGAGADGLIQAAGSLSLRPELPVYVAVYQLALRHPVPVARQIADIAAMAPGKLILGVGLGGEDRHEAEVCGVNPATRGRRTDEALTVVASLLKGEKVTLCGREIQVREALILPHPSAPVPIIVGGRSDAALARAARYGDGWIGIWLSARRFAEAVQTVEAQAVPLGRDGRTWSHALNVWCGLGQTHEAARRFVERGMQEAYHLPYESFARWSPAGTAADVAQFLAPYVEAGCSAFNLIPCGEDSDATIAMAAEVRALLRRQT